MMFQERSAARESECPSITMSSSCFIRSGVAAGEPGRATETGACPRGTGRAAGAHQQPPQHDQRPDLPLVATIFGTVFGCQHASCSVGTRLRGRRISFGRFRLSVCRRDDVPPSTPRPRAGRPGRAERVRVGSSLWLCSRRARQLESRPLSYPYGRLAWDETGSCGELWLSLWGRPLAWPLQA